MKKRKNKSLLMQFIGIILIIILVLFIAMGITNSIENYILRQNTISANEKMMEQTRGKIEQFYEDMQNQVTALSYSPTISQFLNADTLGRTVNFDELENVFTNAMLIQENILGITVYDKQLNKVASAGVDALTQEVTKLTDHMVITDIFYFDSNDKPYYAIYYPIYDLNSEKYNDRIGMSVVLMDTDNLSELLSDSQITEHTQIYLLDKKNELVAGCGVSERESLSGILQNEDYYMVSCELRQTQWKLQVRIPNEELLGDTGELKVFSMVAYGFVIVILGFLLAFCYRNVIRPISRLDAFIKRNARHPQERMEPLKDNEIGKLSENLNQMLDEREVLNNQIQDSKEKLYQMELSGKQMEILAYRNQINPHFLYNTFECIRAMALFYEMDEIADITSNLSEVFRYAVKGSNWVTIEEELSYIEKYAKIIEFRFAGKITVKILVPDQLLQVKIIKLMLQPLVENAVFHGLEPKVDPGQVTVTVTEIDGESFKIEVADNGCGISEQKLQEIRKSIKEAADIGEIKKNIGLTNIFQRLRLYYGVSASFEIESTEGTGTRITIILPVKNKEDLESGS